MGYFSAESEKESNTTVYSELVNYEKFYDMRRLLTVAASVASIFFLCIKCNIA